MGAGYGCPPEQIAACAGEVAVLAWYVAVQRLPVTSIFMHEDAVVGNGVKEGAVIAELGGREFRFVPRKRECCFRNVLCLRYSGGSASLFC